MVQDRDMKRARFTEWFIDSGCSNHMSGSEEIFSELNKNFSYSVKLGNDSELQVVGKGTMKILFDGIYFTIMNVYFIPELKSNLLSLCQLQEKGLKIVFNKDSCRVKQGLS